MAALTRHHIEADGATFEVLLGDHEGPIVCAQHPYFSNLDQFQWLAEETGFVYVYARGQEGSTPVAKPADLSTRSIVEDLDAVRRALGIDRWVIEGFSAGSQVALTYALTFPRSITGLITYGGFASKDLVVGDPGCLLSPLNPIYADDLASLPAGATTGRPTTLPSDGLAWLPVGSQAWALFRGDQPIQMSPGEHADDRLMAILEEGAAFDIAGRLTEITAPTLVVGGRNDPLIPIAATAAIQSVIGNSRLLVLENSGHGAEGDDEEIFRDAVRGLLTRI